MPASVLPALIPHAIDDVPETLAGGVVAVGNFDGMHAGHRALLDAARAKAAERRRPTVVLTFEPHPRTYFRPTDPVFRLTPLAAKARLMRALAVDGLVVARFDAALATMPADRFVEDILVKRLRVAAAVVGYNFHFGKARSGSPQMLTAAGERLGFAVTVVERVTGAGGASISSSTVRDALAAGDIALANRQLGYRWFAVGRVERGAQRGRAIGFPTANIGLAADCRLRHGIYSVRLQRHDGTIHDGVASYGRRPTFDNGNPILEVFLLDVSPNLYGEEVAVSFVNWIRAEEKFASVQELVAAIQVDVATARRQLAEAGPGTGLDRALAAVV